MPHPDDKKSYLVCGYEGKFTINPCPNGLVFNKHVNRCDYSEEEPLVSKQVECLCQNEAKCIRVENSTEFTCECKAGYHGKLCELNVDDCFNNNNACGLNNKCLDLVNGYVCLCGNSFYGADCDLRSKVKQSTHRLEKVKELILYVKT